jgi:folate-binding protein YgfZ
MIASFIITAENENSYLLITSKAIIEKILPRLKMFILRSKVTITPSNHNIYLTNDALTDAKVIKLASGVMLNITPNVDTSATEDTTLWHKALVEHGIPMIYPESSEKIIPQQVNYELIGGVNFKKGCYTGQEIVARTHYLGKIKRRMFKFCVNHEPIIGQIVVSPSLDNQEVGFIVDYYPARDNQFHGLVSLQIDCSNNAYLDVENKFKLSCETLIEE